MHRNIFPASSVEKLMDLWKTKVQDLRNSHSTIIKDCVKACLKSTYQFLFENCYELYTREFQVDPNETTDHDGPQLDSVDFWHKLIALIVSVIEEDRNSYAPILKQFPQELNIAQVKWLHTKYIKDVPPYCGAVPEYPAWFEPFVMQWLDENDEVSLEYVNGAFERDMREGFQKSSEHALFSHSAVDVFIQLTQCFDVISKLECPDQEICKRYMKRFAETIVKVLVAYVDIVKKEFLEHIEEERVACILMNNIQQLRVQLEKMFTAMGGTKLEPDATDILNDLQQTLNSTLDDLASMFAQCLEIRITASVKELRELLQKVDDDEAPDQFQPLITATHREADEVVRPLMDVLDGPLTIYSESCEKTVLKRLLKELWKTVMKIFEKTIVFPPMTDRTMILKNLKNNAKKIEDTTQLFKSTVSKQGVKRALSSVMDIFKERLSAEKSLTAEQCAVIDTVLLTIKQYFHAGGLKNTFFENSLELQSLRYALSIYTQTTDTLIRTFITSQQNQDAAITEEDSVGEVFLQVDLFTHPSTGEHHIIVKVVAANGLKWVVTSGTFRSFIEVNLIGPQITDKKRKFTTKSKSNFMVSATEQLKLFELHVCVRDYCFAREDRLVGVAVMRLADIAEQGSCTCWLPLGTRLKIDETGWTILRTLSQRHCDVVAREFVKLKSEMRAEAPTKSQELL